MFEGGEKRIKYEGRINKKETNKLIEPTKTDLRREMWSFKAKLMHDPTSFNPIRSSIFVENQSLSHPYNTICPRINHRTILPRRLPVSRRRRSIRPISSRILAISKTEEVPLI